MEFNISYTLLASCLPAVRTSSRLSDFLKLRSERRQDFRAFSASGAQSVFMLAKSLSDGPQLIHEFRDGTANSLKADRTSTALWLESNSRGHSNSACDVPRLAEAYACGFAGNDLVTRGARGLQPVSSLACDTNLDPTAHLLPKPECTMLSTLFPVRSITPAGVSRSHVSPLMLGWIRLGCWLLLWGCTSGVASAAFAQEEEYPVPPEALKQEGVPVGTVSEAIAFSSAIYPGTHREYWVYVPAQYDPEKPACTIIVQDGLPRANGWRLPQVFDNLIHSGDMPVAIGIFVSPGVLPAAKEEAQPRYNRSFEYDSLGDRYARFLLEELIPEVSKSYNLSTDPNDRMLAGSSSGGVCAFNAAWQRPDAFRRVLSTVGTFVGLRGADNLSTLVRKHEPKPLRIFLQDGSQDLNIYAGDWWVANQGMLSALTWSGYDVGHVWGTGGHNAKHSAAIVPEALRWLWRDYPEPITASTATSKNRRIDLLIEGEGWQQISSGHEAAAAPACNAAGELFFCDAKAERIYRIGEDGKTRIFADQSGNISSMAFAPDGMLYACKNNNQIVRFDAAGVQSVVVADAKCQYLVTLPAGFYYSDPSTPAIWFSDYAGATRRAALLTQAVSAMAPTTDQAFMHLASKDQQSTLHLMIGAAGDLEHKQRYGYLHMPYLELSSGASAIVVDQESRPIVATACGLQVMDQLGRVNLILQNPNQARVTGLAFGGAAKSVLYATSGGSVYRRLLHTQGVSTFASPTQPPKPGL